VARPSDPVAVVLAAGAASRFGSAKVIAPLDARPLLAHVLDAITQAGIERTVVVLGASAEDVEAAIDWPDGITRVRNLEPSRGLASSLRIGFAVARRTWPAADAVLVALGDQPRLDASVVRVLLATDHDGRPVVVPRYEDGSNPNPVLLRRSAFGLVGEAMGDRGLGPVLAAHEELVQEVPVAGTNPDVDTPADLARIRGSAERVS
jgi:molybdenum cofactor cytidylyltransferase